MKKYNGVGTYTFQALLYSDGRIQFRYKTLTGDLSSCTVGILDSNKTLGLQIVNSAAYLTDEMAVEIRPLSEFFSLAPLSGNVPANSIQTLDGLFQAYKLPPAVYYVEGSIAHDGAGTSPQQVNARLQVIIEDSDGDGMPNDWEIANGLNRLLNDAFGDLDSDGLTNLEEYQHGTKPNSFDTDGDNLPDPWEITYGLDPLSAEGDNGADGDIEVDGITPPQTNSIASYSMTSATQKGDGVANRNEFLNGTDPTKTDTDGDGTSDADEMNQGSNASSAADGGQPPVDPIKEVEFNVGGDYASWRMEIKSLGPRDTRTLLVVSPAPGSNETKSHKLWKNNKYEITMHHTGSKADEPHVWYCWEARIDGKPTAETFNTLPDYQIGERNANGTFFMVKDHWVVDNRDGLLTTHLDSKGVNHVTGKKAFLVPVAIEDNLPATGVDAVSTTVNPAEKGYQKYFWIMAPCVGAASNNDMRFKIPLDPAANLKIEPAHSTPNPNTTSLSTANPGPIVTWSGNGTATMDDTPIWKIGPNEEAIELPISVKTMKKRTVKVAVHSISSVVPNRPNDPPNLMPTKSQLDLELNKIFGLQVNAYFDCEMLPQEDIAFDIADAATTFPGLTFAPGILPPVPGDKILSFTAWETGEVGLLTANRSINYDVHVYVFGGATPIVSYKRSEHNPLELVADRQLLGLATDPGPNYCIVDGDRDRRTYDLDGNPTGYIYSESKRSLVDVIHTIAHEIGHIVLPNGAEGGGHPDEEQGVAPLVSTDRTKRLMCSGPRSSNTESKLLVKKEWDSAEIWLKNRPLGDN